MEENLTILTKYIKVDIKDLFIEISTDLHVPQLEQLQKCSTEDCYCIYLEHILLYIINNVNFNSDSKEDLISSRHLNLCIEAIQDLANLVLHQQLHPLLRSHPIFGSNSQHNSIPNYVHLQVAIAVFVRILGIKQFHLANSMECVLRDYIGGIFTLFIANELQEHKLTEEFSINLQEKLNLIWSDISEVEYFRNILFLKGIKQLPSQVQKRLHQELLNKLLSKNGFTTLVTTLITAQQSSKEDAEHNNKQTFEIIANIVAFKGHSKRFQSIMLRQILKFINLCVRNESMTDSMGAGLLTLRRLYDLNEENQVQIKVWLHSYLKQLIQPDDLLSGLILMEHKEFCILISQFYHIFCTSSVECLPSEILIFYLPLLMQLFYALPENFLQKNQLKYLITRCLSNRTPAELCTIVGQLYKGNFDDRWIKLHERILIYPNANCTELNLKIASAEHKQENIVAVALPELLLTGDHNILTYQVFMSLLQHMNDFLYEDDDISAVTSQINLLQTQEELITFLNNKYPVKIDILLSLNTLISHDGLKTQLIENSAVFMNFLRQSIEKRASISSSEQRESADQTLLIMLTLAQEILEFTQIPGSYVDFVAILKILKAQTPNQLIKQRIDCILMLLLDDYKPQKTGQQTVAPYNVARSLIESKESHLQVYGIQMLLDLLRRRDTVTMSNTHVIIALALATLKHKESYTFLNCVRLFVGLTDIMEAEVLEVLSDEYLNDNASIDFRLIVGEAIVKVSKELGTYLNKYIIVTA